MPLPIDSPYPLDRKQIEEDDIFVRGAYAAPFFLYCAANAIDRT
jgi:hypothetical protein